MSLSFLLTTESFLNPTRSGPILSEKGLGPYESLPLFGLWMHLLDQLVSNCKNRSTCIIMLKQNVVASVLHLKNNLYKEFPGWWRVKAFENLLIYKSNENIGKKKKKKKFRINFLELWKSTKGLQQFKGHLCK